MMAICEYTVTGGRLGQLELWVSGIMIVDSGRAIRGTEKGGIGDDFGRS